MEKQVLEEIKPMKAYEFIKFSKDWKLENRDKQLDFIVYGENERIVACHWLDPYMGLLIIEGCNGFCRMQELLGIMGQETTFMPLPA
jgi:hypothetical protein